MSKKNNSEITSDANSVNFSAEKSDGSDSFDVKDVENTAEISSSAIPRETAAIGDQTFVYIGPSIGRTELVNGRVFMKGTSLDDKFGDIFAKIPSARKLFIPVAQLGAAQEKLRNGGNALSAAYQAVIKEMEVNK